MPFDFQTLDLLRKNHPAWRLLCSDHAPLVATFLHRVFIKPNIRVMALADLAESLEDELFLLREAYGSAAFPRSAQEYLNDWADNSKGWLRKYYPPGVDEPHFDLTSASEKAISWLESLAERSFVGTESRLLTLFALLRQIAEGSEADPKVRMSELQKRRDEIDREIERIEAGDISLLDDTAVKDRFQQFLQLARELLADFREVENNFRTLDRQVRERIALWDGNKGELLQEIMGRRDAIADSDQGKSFRAFWDFLMSQSRQEELTGLLEQVLALEPVTAMAPDPRLRRVHYDWLEAGEHTQRTVARLSQQLRRFLDDQAWLENRRIMELLHEIESKAIGVRETAPAGNVMEMNEFSATVELPFERPLFKPTQKLHISDITLEEGEAEMDTAALYAQVMVNRAELARHIRQVLQSRAQISLAELISLQPLQLGLAELLAYLQLASERPNTVIDETIVDTIEWTTKEGAHRRAGVARILFTPTNKA